MPTIEEARALQPGALLRVNDALTYDPEHYGVADIVLLHGYIYRFREWIEGEVYPIQCTSLASGKPMEFNYTEVEIIKEQDDDIL